MHYTPHTTHYTLHTTHHYTLHTTHYTLHTTHHYTVTTNANAHDNTAVSYTWDKTAEEKKLEISSIFLEMSSLICKCLFYSTTITSDQHFAIFVYTCYETLFVITLTKNLTVVRKTERDKETYKFVSMLLSLGVNTSCF